MMKSLTKKKSLTKNRKTVEMELPKGLVIGMADARFRVSNDDGIIGELQVSKGAVVWFPRDAKKGYKLDWFRFDDLMQEKGARCEKRR